METIEKLKNFNKVQKELFAERLLFFMTTSDEELDAYSGEIDMNANIFKKSVEKLMDLECYDIISEYFERFPQYINVLQYDKRVDVSPQ